MKTQAERDQFFALVEENKKIIYKVSSAYCRNAEDRKDLVQEILMQLWKSSERFDDRFRLSTWIYRIAMNVAISHYRRQKREGAETVSIDEGIIDVIDDKSSSDELAGRIPLLYRFIDGLDEVNRALIILYLEENSYKTIAEILGITETNVATKLGRIKKKLQQDLTNRQGA